MDAITHSKKYWQDEPTAIFVVEDDAQGGLDHVEGHRTVGLGHQPIQPAQSDRQHELQPVEYAADDRADSRHQAAQPVRRRRPADAQRFQEKGDFRPYMARKNEIALNLKNPPLKRLSGTARHWAAVSAQLDFSEPDRADPENLTEALWHHTHGDEAYPPPTAH